MPTTTSSGRSFVRRSSSVGSTAELDDEQADIDVAKRLISSLLHLKNSVGESYLHSGFRLSWAKELLDRAKFLDEGKYNIQHRRQQQQHKPAFQREFLLQRDAESGYTPLHRAIVRRNLPAVLLLMRHAMDETSTGRLTQRPMTVLQATEGKSNINNHNNNNSVLMLMARAVDNERMTPFSLMRKLQQSDLLRCRNYLSSFQKNVDRNVGTNGPHNRRQRQRPSFDEGDRGGINDSSDEGEGETGVDFFSESADFLQTDDENSDSDLGENQSHDAKHLNRNSLYACEVVTFGRPDHCGLGTVQGGSKNMDINDGHTRGGGSFRPHRVQEFAIETVGRQDSAIAVAAATHHTLVVTKQGRLYSFGLEKCGRLGLGDKQSQQCPLPKRVLGPLQRRKVVNVAAAENHSLCVTKSGDVYSWGSNRFGQLGNGNSATTTQCASRSVPRRVEDLKLHPCVAVAAGTKHSVALSTKGEVYVWGDNQAGQLAVARRSGIHKVQRVEALWSASSPKVAIAIAAAEQSTLALIGSTSLGPTNVNTIYEWGWGNHVPIRIHFDATTAEVCNNGHKKSSSFSSRFNRVANPTAVACARYHNAAITSDGLVFTWGLRGESLGRESKKIQQQQQRRNSLPQLVTGMLPERGGGFAVAVDASDSHTAVVCDDGSLYTWGTTNENNVLGHEGVRWQPNPKRVPNVHRAADVAVAKEHTVLLIGTSFRKIPKCENLSSLEHYAASKVAEYIDLFNVLPITIMAERTQSQFLISYCTDFIQRNFDGVLNYARKNDMNQYLNDMLAESESTYRPDRRFRDDHHHPFIYDLIAAAADGNSTHSIFDRDFFPGNEEWIQGCKKLSRSPIVQRLLALENVRADEENVRGVKSRSRSGSSSLKEIREVNQSINISNDFATAEEGRLDACIKKIAKIDLSTIQKTEEHSVWLSKEIRGIRKKLNQISKLRDKTDSDLSAEQKVKINRQPILEAELSIYDSAVKDVEKRMNEFNEEENRNERHCDIPVQTNGADKDEENRCSQNIGNGGKEENEPKSYYCQLCGVRCSDEDNLFLHQKGRKHRNRVAQATEEEKERAAISIRQQRQIDQMKSALVFTPPSRKKNEIVWGTPSRPHYKLQPPPHPVVPPVSPLLSNPRTTVRRKSISSNLNFEVQQNRKSAKMKNEKLKQRSERPTEVNRGKNIIINPIESNKTIMSYSACNFSAILKEQEMARKGSDTTFLKTTRHVEPIKWASTSGSTRCVPLYMYGNSSSSEAVQSTTRHVNNVSLADFFTPSREMVLSSSPSVTQPAPWSKSKSSSNAKKEEKAEVDSGKSMLEIQAEEEALKANQDKSYGKGGGSWYVERRERAESVLEIQKNAQEDLEYRRMVAEQMEIEAQIREENDKRKQIDNTQYGNKGKKKDHGKGGNKKENSSRRIRNNRKNSNEKKKKASNGSKTIS